MRSANGGSWCHGRDAGRKQVILLTESVREDAVALYRAAGYENHWTGFKKKP